MRYRRKQGGKQLRAAMAEADLTMAQLAELTAHRGRPVSDKLIGMLCTTEPWGRDNTSERSALAVADALGVEVLTLFDEVRPRKPIKVDVGTRLVGKIRPTGTDDEWEIDAVLTG